MTEERNHLLSGDGGDGMAGTTEELQDALQLIQGVRGVRVSQAPTGDIDEIHVLSTRERGPKQIVRDVQSVLMARFGMPIDYRCVSVVQLEDPAAAATTGSPGVGAGKPRPAVARVTSMSEGQMTSVSVELMSAGETLTGSAKGPGSAGLKAVARATLEAVEGLLGDIGVDVDFAGLVDAGSHPVALVVLHVATARGDQVVCGSSRVRKDPNDAMARAVLSGLNRFIEAGA